MGFTDNLGALGDEGTDLFNFLELIAFSTNISITKDPVENEYVSVVNGLNYITVNPTYPILI